MDIHSEIKGAQLEHKSASETYDANKKGKIYLETTDDVPEIHGGTEIEKLVSDKNFKRVVLNAAYPIGSIQTSFMDVATFQGAWGDNWVHITGQSLDTATYPELALILPNLISGSDIVLPNSGTYLRNINGAGGLNPDGTMSPGQFQGDQFESHNHSYIEIGTADVNIDISGGTDDAERSTETTGNTGGNETRPMTTNCFFYLKVK